MSNRDDRIILTDHVVRCPASIDQRNIFNGWNLPPVPMPENHRFYVHSNLRPSDIFEVRVNRCSRPGYRFVRKNNVSQMLMFVDGACTGNGTPNARAGWAVCLGPQIVIKGRLEPKGGPQTSNRAELRAAIVAIGLSAWTVEGFTSIVLAGDSEYVIKGYCENLPKWKQRGWKTSAGREVMNRDLWEALDEKIQSLARRGAQVFFWQVRREWNEADKYAKEATTLLPSEGSPTEPVILSTGSEYPSSYGDTVNISTGYLRIVQ